MLKINKIIQPLIVLTYLIIVPVNAQVGIGTTSPTAQLTVTEDAIFNESGDAHDFRIESDTSENMFFIDGTLNRIGINTNAPGNVVHFKTTGVNKWLTYWENDALNVGALAQFYHTNSNNGNRVLMGITNYSGSTYDSSGVMGMSLNTTTIGSGGIGVLGAANNERGNAVEGALNYSGPYLGWAGYFNADLYCAGSFTGSDRRLKRDINPITNALDVLNLLNPVSYYFDTETYPNMGLDEDRKSFGFIAQDLETVVPEMVKEKLLVLNSNTEKKTDMSSERESDTFKVVNYTLLIPIITQAIKEQQVIIGEQNEKIDSLEQRIINLENRINRLLEIQN